MKVNSDLAGEAYWSTLWETMKSYQPISMDDASVLNHMNQQFDALFAQFLGPITRSGGDLIEIGCARSEWLPYFARRFGLRIHGLDYSDIGCRQAKEALRLAAVDGEIRQGDLFMPPADWEGRFDIVISWGLIEHFHDTAGALRAVARFAKPGGLVLTIIPNMHGTVGLLQRLLNRPVFDVHVQISADRLRANVEAAGLEVLYNDWFGVSNYWVDNLAGLNKSTLSYWAKRQLLRAACTVSVGLWMVERRFGRLPAVRAFAPFVVSVARLAPIR